MKAHLDPQDAICRAYLAERLAAALITQNLSLRGAASHCDVSKAHICNILNGKTSPSLDTLFKLMRGLEMPTLLTDIELLL